MALPSLSNFQRQSQGVRRIHAAHAKPVILAFITRISQITELPCFTASLQQQCLTTGPWFVPVFDSACALSHPVHTLTYHSFYFPISIPQAPRIVLHHQVCLQRDSSLPVTADTQVLYIEYIIIIKYIKLEGTHMDHKVQLPASLRTT